MSPKRLLALVLILIAALWAMVFWKGRKRPGVRMPPPYTAAVTPWDGPNACQPATSFVGSFLGGLICHAPAAIGTAPGSTRIDFNFGGTTQALTPPTYVHGYSLPTPISATNRYVAVNTPDGRHWVLDLVAKQYIGIPGSSNSPLWDSDTDEIFYYASGAQWHRHNAIDGSDAVVADAAAYVKRIENGGSTHVSRDMWTAFFNQETGNVCATDLRAGRTYCASYQAPEATGRVKWDSIDYTMATDIDQGSGQRYILLMGTPALGAWTVDTGASILRFAFRGGENPAYQSFNQDPKVANGDGHCDLGENCLNAPHGDVVSVAGIQYFVSSTDTVYDPCERDLVAMRISDGEAMVPRRLTILPLAYCSSPWPEWPNLHVGCSSKSGTCAISTDTRSVTPYGNVVMYMPDFAHVYKMLFHQSIQQVTDTYWFQARAGISWDGRYIVYGSNSGQADEGQGFSHNQVFLIRTGSQRAR